MPHPDSPALRGVVVEDYTVLGVDELGRLCTVERHRIVELIEEGIVSATADETGEWRVAGASLRRAKMALRLQRDLGVNLAGAALALDLIDELEQLRREHRVGR